MEALPSFLSLCAGLRQQTSFRSEAATTALFSGKNERMWNYFLRLASLLKKRDVGFVLLFAVLCAILVYLPTGFEKNAQKGNYRAEALVLSVDDSDLRRNVILKSGSQTLEVRILEGEFKGRTVTAYNYLKGKLELDEIYAPGNRLLLEFNTKDDKPWRAVARGRYRLGTEALLMASFTVLLLLVGGFTGVKALLSFVFTALMLWKVLVPLFLKGYDPTFIALGVAALLTASISFLIGGLNRKGLVTFLGSFMGLATTCAVALLFSKGFMIHGAVRPFAEQLLYSGFYYLDLTRIFLAGIYIASSGAVMDLAMDVSASMHELKEKHPDISLKEHIGSGLAVGRAVIGTMTTTLLLAYSGSSTCMLMLFMGQGVPLENILNINFVAAEVFNTLVGSFGVITVAPFTALVGGFVYGPWKDKKR